MKLHLFIASLVVAVTFNAGSASPGEETRFLASVKSAFEKKDSKLFLSLFCWDRVPDFIKSFSEKTAPATLDVEVDNITMVDASKEYIDLQFVREGVTYRPNLTVTKQIKVIIHTSPPKMKSKGKLTMSVGEKDGKLYFTTAAPKK